METELYLYCFSFIVYVSFYFIQLFPVAKSFRPSGTLRESTNIKILYLRNKYNDTIRFDYTQ